DDMFELTFLADFGPLQTLSFRIIYAERPKSRVKLNVFNSKGFVVSEKFREAFNFTDNSSLLSSTAKIQISNEFFSLSFNSSGNLNSVSVNGETIPVELTFQ
ncbi:unnamed protein product, partial [Allacma fusca]